MENNMEENKLWHFHNGGRVYIDGRAYFMEITISGRRAMKKIMVAP